MPQSSVRNTVPGIKAVITYHFEVLFRDMLDKSLDKLQCREDFGHENIVFVAVIMKSYRITVIVIDSGGGDGGPSKIPSDVFFHSPGVTFVRFGINVKAVRVIAVNGGSCFVEGRAEPFFHLTKQGGLKRISEQLIIEMFYMAPETMVTEPAFRDETVDVRIPFKITAEGVEDADKTGSEILRAVEFAEHAKNDTANSGKEDAEKRPVREKEGTQLLGNGKDTVPVDHIEDLKGHGSGTVDGIFISAGRAEPAVTTERNKLVLPTVTGVHCTTKRRVTTMKHSLDVVNNRLPGMQQVNHFFIMVIKNRLEFIHKSIMERNGTKEKPHPSRLRGRGAEVSKTLFYSLE